MHYRARAPLRIDFGGGWTDVPLYAEREGGAVLNAAITRYATGSISRPDREPGWRRVIRAARSSLSYHVDVPTGAGLGASAAQTVLWVTLVKSTIANVSDRRELAEIACGVESRLGILGGKQDEYASALGGFNFLTFRDTVDAQRLHLDPSFAGRLRSHLLLVFTGERRQSSDVHAAVWERYRAGHTGTTAALAGLARIAEEQRDALLHHDLPAFLELVADNWKLQLELHPAVSTPAIDDLITLARRHGGWGGKACGAGGGGCVLLLLPPDRRPDVLTAPAGVRLQPIDFDFDSYGVFLTKA